MAYLPEDSTLDPRIRRSCRRLQKALMQLLQEKPYAEISITDITRKAGLARVTFYHHFTGKEDLLLSLVADFFEDLYSPFDLKLFQRFIEGGTLEIAQHLPAQEELGPRQVRLIKVALHEIGPAVRALAIASFLRAEGRIGFLAPSQREIVATYHVGGMLALLERYLQGDLDVSGTGTDSIPWIFMQALGLEAEESGLLDETMAG